jgi:alpha-glucosidase
MLALLFCMRGDICLYQGEELGLPQADVPFERLQDPFGKFFWPKFKGRDGCRTPMPWNDKLHGGFSRVEPWLPVCDEHRALNVEQQEADPDSVLHFYRHVIALRKAHPALIAGAIELVDAQHAILAFRRISDEEELLCLFNMDVVEHSVPCTFSAIAFGQHAVAEEDRIVLGVSGFCVLAV